VLDFQRGKRGVALELRPLGANPHARVVAERRLAGKVNYFVGRRAHTGIATYSQLRYRNLWPGIDMALRADRGKLKYEFLVRPGADPSDIRLAYTGADQLALADDGSLLVATSLGGLHDAAPASYQPGASARAPVESRYSVDATSYGFDVGRYDHRRPLVIDPGLVYSTYLGGERNDFGLDIAADADGNLYVTGQTDSSAFPTTTGAYDTTIEGAARDAFVTKFSPAGQLVYSTYLGGTDGETASGIAVDGAGSAYVTGTASTDFPTTPGTDRSLGGANDVFVTKLSPAGDALVYSTYLGGSGIENHLHGIAVDQAGSAYTIGQTSSTDFPITGGAPDTTMSGGDAFVAKLDPTGRALDYATYLGGRFNDVPWNITIDASGNAYILGETESTDFPTTPGAYDTVPSTSFDDGFVTKINATGTAFVYSTLWGQSVLNPGGIEVDAAGNAYFSAGGYLPATPGAFDTSDNDGSFVAKLNATGSQLLWATHLGTTGGGGGTEPDDIAVDSAGNVYLTGHTQRNIPTTPAAYDTTHAGGTGADEEAIVMKFNATGTGLLYSSYLGGSDNDFGSGIELVGPNVVALTGVTNSTDFPTTPDAFDSTLGTTQDAFVTKLQLYDGYPRPKGATPIVAALVTAFRPCAAQNSTHGPPLDRPSCNPPVQVSQYLTPGTFDVNERAPKMIGSLRLDAVPGNPSTAADEADVAFNADVTDIRRKNDLEDYTGELRASLKFRITDLYNGSAPAPGTAQDVFFPITVPCEATADTTIGGHCALQTTLDSVIPGSIREGKRSTWDLLDTTVFDGGSDGVSSTHNGDNTIFLTKGIFIP
jgi:hypothetical protein